MDYGPYGYFDGLSRYQAANKAPARMGNYYSGNNFAGNMLGQGIDTMNNLGKQIGGSFAMANAQSGENMKNQVPVDVERMRQQGQMQRLQALSPLLAQIFGGGGGGGRAGGIKTNYGASVGF